MTEPPADGKEEKSVPVVRYRPANLGRRRIFGREIDKVKQQARIGGLCSLFGMGA